jgi:hypothetical protein
VPTIPGAFTSGSTMSVAAPPPAEQAQQPMGEQAYKQQQLDQLMQQNLPYEEYRKRYKQITGE